MSQMLCGKSHRRRNAYQPTDQSHPSVLTQPGHQLVRNLAGRFHGLEKDVRVVGDAIAVFDLLNLRAGYNFAQLLQVFIANPEQPKRPSQITGKLIVIDSEPALAPGATENERHHESKYWRANMD